MDVCDVELWMKCCPECTETFKSETGVFWHFIRKHQFDSYEMSTTENANWFRIKLPNNRTFGSEEIKIKCENRSERSSDVQSIDGKEAISLTSEKESSRNDDSSSPEMTDDDFAQFFDERLIEGDDVTIESPVHDVNISLDSNPSASVVPDALLKITLDEIQAAVIAHNQFDGNTKRGVYPCPLACYKICAKKFETISALNDHVTVNHAFDDLAAATFCWKCLQCPKTGSGLGAYKKHIVNECCIQGLN